MSCRFCGARGDDVDQPPAIGVCPACLEQRLAHITMAAERLDAAGSELVGPYLVRQLAALGIEQPASLIVAIADAPTFAQALEVWQRRVDDAP